MKRIKSRSVIQWQQYYTNKFHHFTMTYVMVKYGILVIKLNIPRLSEIVLIKKPYFIESIRFSKFNPLQPRVAFLYPLKTSENL